MKLPLFRRERSVLKAGAAQDQAERLLAESFRLLGQVCAKMAELIEAQRLSRAGYPDQNTLLRRVEQPGAAEK